MLAWLETSALAEWVALSLYAYPMLLSFHIVGLAVVVGIFSMRDLRLLGVVPAPAPAAFVSLGKLAWCGFAINAVSGLLLFSSQATIFIASVPFLSKIGCIVLGMSLAFLIQGRLAREQGADGGAAAAANPRLRGLALLSLLCWLGAIIAGRLIAYL